MGGCIPPKSLGSSKPSQIFLLHFGSQSLKTYMAMNQYLLIPFLEGWTSIYQLLLCSPGVQGFDPLPHIHLADASPPTSKTATSPHHLIARPRKSGRSETLSVALPASIVENAQGGELKALLVGQMARALTIYGVDEAMMGCDGMGELISWWMG